MKHKVPKLVSLESAGGDGDEIPHQPMSALEVASFIESIAAELRTMARNAKFGTLTYFLEMARIEASSEVVRLASPRKESH